MSGGPSPEDRAHLDAFLTGTVERFGHVEHVRVAWVLLCTAPFDVARARMSDGLQRFAAAAGVPDKFDGPLTDDWMRRIEDRRRTLAAGHRWSDFAATAPDLLRHRA